VGDVVDAVEVLMARYPASQDRRRQRISNSLSKKFPMIVS